ncbi:Uncharacterized protein NV38_0003694 [Leptospira kirschneri serovar Mozdok]|nr:Uncharacterized protein NV38_0003694 [Leptospira kirschneri serovar Mozdok]
MIFILELLKNSIVAIDKTASIDRFHEIKRTEHLFLNDFILFS